MFAKKSTVDEIIRPVSDVIKNLENLSVEMTEKAEATRQEIDAMERDREETLKERDRADKLAKLYNNLIS